MKMVGSTYMTIVRAKKIKMKNIFSTVVTVNLNLSVYHQNLKNEASYLLQEANFAHVKGRKKYVHNLCNSCLYLGCF